MSKLHTPVMLEILIRHYYSVTPLNSSPAALENYNYLYNAGMTTNISGDVSLTEKGNVFVECLLSIPFPQKEVRFVIDMTGLPRVETKKV